jgi:hypothetical protein
LNGVWDHPAQPPSSIAPTIIAPTMMRIAVTSTD